MSWKKDKVITVRANDQQIQKLEKIQAFIKGIRQGAYQGYSKGTRADAIWEAVDNFIEVKKL